MNVEIQSAPQSVYEEGAIVPKLLLSLLIVVAIASAIIFWPTQKLSSVPIPQTVTTNIEPAIATDRIALPPVRQTFTNGPYKLVISAKDQWQTPMTVGQLYEGSTLRWQKDLPHEYGPRFALISSAGQVLLLDEFINVASPYALTLINPAGELVVQRSFDSVQKALDISSATLTQQATSGWWISAPPGLNARGDRALVQTGGTTLEIDLTTGELSCRPNL